MIPQSGDMMIVDATSNLDRSDTKLFHLMCPSAIGGLPLGTLMVTKEDESTIRVALETLKENHSSLLTLLTIRVLHNY